MDSCSAQSRERRIEVAAGVRGVNDGTEMPADLILRSTAKNASNLI